MRPRVDEPRIRALARQLARVTSTPVRIYLTGGATAVLHGWRASTIEVDMRLEPDADPLLRELPRLKEALQVNIELTSPPDFIPELPGWRERSPFAFREGRVDVHHFDLCSQALAKIERGFAHDLDDVGMMIEQGLVDPSRLGAFYDDIESALFRYPAIDPSSFRHKVQTVLAQRRR